MVPLNPNGTQIVRNKDDRETKTIQTLQVDGKGLAACSTTLLLSEQAKEANGTNHGESTTGSKNTTEIYHRKKNGRNNSNKKITSGLQI